MKAGPARRFPRFRIEGVDVWLPLNARQREKIEKIDESEKRRNSMDAKLTKSGAKDLEVDHLRGKVHFHVDRLHLAHRVCRKLEKILAPRKKRQKKKA